MKRIIFTLIVLTVCLAIRAQEFEVEFTVNKEQTTATYKVTNYTGFFMGIMKAFLPEDETKSQCVVYYKSSSEGKTERALLDVLPDYTAGTEIKPGQSYTYQIDLTPFKGKNIVKLEACFFIAYYKSVKEYEFKRIIKSIELE